jgi:26S proteasome regulatory subunit N4
MTTMNSNSDLQKDYRNSITSLDLTRKALEEEAEGIVSELEAPSGPDFDGLPMGIDTPLVDADGYPRGDVDIYRARSLRGRLAVIRTDHKALMKQMEDSLVHLAELKNPTGAKDEEELKLRTAPKPKPKFDPRTGKWVVKNWDGSVAGIPGGDQRSFEALQAGTIQEEHTSIARAHTAATPQPQQLPVSMNSSTVPFARINVVALHSPAATAGLSEGDIVTRFGTVHHENHRQLAAIGELVPLVAEQKGALNIVVLRDHVIHELTLKPQPWDGRGLLGCHIVPYTE